MSQKWIKKNHLKLGFWDWIKYTSELSLALSKKEEEWFFITSTLDGKMLHKLFFYEKCNFWKCYSSTNSRARSSRILKKHSHYTFCLSFQTSRIIWKNIWILKLPVSKHTFFCNIFPFLVHFTALVAYLFLKKIYMYMILQKS